MHHMVIGIMLTQTKILTKTSYRAPIQQHGNNKILQNAYQGLLESDYNKLFIILQIKARDM